MTKIYSKIQCNFTQIANHVTMDSRLSGTAYKLFCYMCTRLSGIPSWQFNEKEILSHFREGREAIRAAKKLLIKYDYLIIRQSRSNSGNFTPNDYYLNLPSSEKTSSDYSPLNTDSPPSPRNPSTEQSPLNIDSSPSPRNPSTVNPSTVKPSTVNPSHIKKELIKKKNIKKEESLSVPTISEIKNEVRRRERENLMKKGFKIKTFHQWLTDNWDQLRNRSLCAQLTSWSSKPENFEILSNNKVKISTLSSTDKIAYKWASLKNCFEIQNEIDGMSLGDFDVKNLKFDHGHIFYETNDQSLIEKYKNLFSGLKIDFKKTSSIFEEF